jgi:hypothetical protein
MSASCLSTSLIADIESVSNLWIMGRSPRLCSSGPNDSSSTWGDSLNGPSASFDSSADWRACFSSATWQGEFSAWFMAGLHLPRCRKAWHLRNQMIYSPDRRSAIPGRDREISMDHPLRHILFEESPGNPSVRDWRARMERNLVLKGSKVYHLPVTLGEGRPATEEWRILEFVLRPAGTPEMVAAQQPADRQRR